MKFNTIVMLGKPGSGKGTQARLLSEKTGFPVFSASGHLKELAAAHPGIGKQLIADIDQGILVPYWIMSYTWMSAVIDLSEEKGIIFDGSVRKLEEAQLFDEVMQYLKRPYVLVYITVSDEELRTRLLQRAQIEGRSDDGEEVIVRRLEQYHQNTEASLAFFREKNMLIEVDGEGSVEEIHERVMRAIS